MQYYYVRASFPSNCLNKIHGIKKFAFPKFYRFVFFLPILRALWKEIFNDALAKEFDGQRPFKIATNCKLVISWSNNDSRKLRSRDLLMYFDVFKVS